MQMRKQSPDPRMNNLCSGLLFNVSQGIAAVLVYPVIDFFHVSEFLLPLLMPDLITLFVRR